MERQIRQLRELVLDSQYVVDEMTVAGAIIARATARRAVMGTTFRNDARGPEISDPDVSSPQVRSFRPSRQARSFRPCNAVNSEDGLATIVPWRRP
jgi:hypothetical protein